MSVQSLWNKFRFSQERQPSLNKLGAMTPRSTNNIVQSSYKVPLSQRKMKQSKSRSSIASSVVNVQQAGYRDLQSPCSKNEQIILSITPLNNNIISEALNEQLKSNQSQVSTVESKIIVKDYLSNRPVSFSQVDDQNQMLKMKCMKLENTMRDMNIQKDSTLNQKQQINDLVATLESRVNYLIEENQRLNLLVEQNSQWQTKYETLQYVQQRIACNTYIPLKDRFQEILTERNI